MATYSATAALAGLRSLSSMADMADLRSLLRAADQSQSHSQARPGADHLQGRPGRTSDRSLDELANLLGSIEKEDEQKKKPSSTTPSYGAAAFGSGLGGFTSTASRYKEFLSEDLPRPEDFITDSDVEAIAEKDSPAEVPDQMDHTVARFHSNYCLRGRTGKYLTSTVENVIQDGATADPNVSKSLSNAPAAPAKVHLLGVDGLGVGDLADCICFINIDNKDDFAAIKYGQVVSVKSTFAKERLLGLRDGVKLGFWRHLIGQGEKWQILRANTAYTPSSGPLGMTNYMGVEDVSARGKFVRLGDSILLQTFKSDHLLSAHEGEGRLVYRERGGGGGEVWQIEMFGTVPLPLWCTNRPYLSGNFLVMPPMMRAPAPEVEARCFPRSVTAAGFLEQPVPQTLDHFPVAVQQVALMREVLLLLAGVEGQYIRIAQQEDAPVPPAHSSAYSNVGGGVYGSAKYEKTVSAAMRLPRVQDVKLVIDLDSADRSSAAKIQQLFPLCEAIIRVRSFVHIHQRYEYGQVSHALCAYIQTIVKDFSVHVSQMEHLLNAGRLTLQKMVFLLHPVTQVVQSVDRLCAEVRERTGGALLHAIHRICLDQGDPGTKRLYREMLEHASQPFMQMMGMWIFRGELVDPYKEFMIRDDPSVSREALTEDFNASYWDTKYTSLSSHTPSYLQTHMGRILVAGKYLNVVKDCVGDYDAYLRAQKEAPGGVAASTAGLAMTMTEAALPQEQPLLMDLDRVPDTLRTIDDTYAAASRCLLYILVQKYGLYRHIASIHKYFLLRQGDFFIQFMDIADEELKKEVKDVQVLKLNYLLHSAIQTSTVSSDEHKEFLACSLASHNLIQHLHLIQMAGESASSDMYSTLSAQQGLKGVEAFTLDYVVKFPVSIVLSRRVVTKYQLLSRLLYFSKHVERRVLAAWMSQQAAQDLPGVRQVLGVAFTLRHRMLHFMQNFVYYITFEVIHPHTHALWEDLSGCGDMDQVISLHEKFLDSCLKNCLLASQDLLKVLTKIMTTCLLFADHMVRFMNEATAGDQGERERERERDRDRGEREREKDRPLKGVGSGSFRKSAPGSPDAQRARTAARMHVILDKRADRVRRDSAFIQREAGHESFVRILTKFSETFDTQLRDFLDHLWNNSHRHHAQLANLCVRLDYNGYYSSQFAPAF